MSCISELRHLNNNFPVDVATATGEFAQSVNDLSASDVGKQLSQSLAGLAEVEQKAQEIQNMQSEQDMVTLMGTGPHILFLIFDATDMKPSRRVR